MAPTAKIQNLLKQLDACPPFVCYYAAQMNRDKRPTLNQLVAVSGMSQRTFGRIAHKTTWAGVTIKHASQFLAACGIDALNPEPVMVWVAQRKASGKLFDDFQNCRGQGQKMLEYFNLLASKTVLEREKAA